MSLDAVAERTQVSKSMLGQIERGESNPTLSVLSRIVDGLQISVEDLLKNKDEDISIVSVEDASVLRQKAGQYQIKSIFPFGANRKFEVCQGMVEPGCTCLVTPSDVDVMEYILVEQGNARITVGQQIYDLKTNQSIRFSADTPHAYRNMGTDILRMWIIMSRENRI